MSLASIARHDDDSASRIDRALARGAEGNSLSREDALLLMNEAPLESLLVAASSLRDRLKGRVVSYSRKVFIPLTHLCRDYCGYCTFRSDPVMGRSPYMTPDEVLAVAQAGARAGRSFVQPAIAGAHFPGGARVLAAWLRADAGLPCRHTELVPRRRACCPFQSRPDATI
jgi:biotin synthase-like enzyme